MKVLSFGEVLFDVIEGTPHLGGAPLNFAAHLAQCGQESYIFSRVGQDELGKEAVRQIEALGVEATFIQKDKTYPTGRVWVSLRQGQPDYTIEEKAAYDFIDAKRQEDKLKAMDFDVLYFGSLAQRSSVSASTLQWLTRQKKFQHIFYDVNLRKNGYTKTIIRDSLKLCTIVKLNKEEVSVVSQMFYPKQDSPEGFSRSLAEDFSVEMVIITAGDKGCYIYQQGKISFIKAYPVQVVDTIGAGDSFSAAFIYRYFQHQDALLAAEAASRLGAFVAGCRGAIPVYSPEIKAMLGLPGI